MMPSKKVKIILSLSLFKLQLELVLATRKIFIYISQCQMNVLLTVIARLIVAYTAKNVIVLCEGTQEIRSKHPITEMTSNP